MVIDTSALIAIAQREPAARALATKINEARSAFLPPICYLEAGMVLSRIGIDPELWLQGFVSQFSIEIVVISEEHAKTALDAFLRYGRGRHPARLNFGDCFAYAVAKLNGLPLLFVGNDFSQTDIAAA